MYIEGKVGLCILKVKKVMSIKSKVGLCILKVKQVYFY